MNNNCGQLLPSWWPGAKKYSRNSDQLHVFDWFFFVKYKTLSRSSWSFRKIREKNANSNSIPCHLLNPYNLPTHYTTPHPCSFCLFSSLLFAHSLNSNLKQKHLHFAQCRKSFSIKWRKLGCVCAFRSHVSRIKREQR